MDCYDRQYNCCLTVHKWHTYTNQVGEHSRQLQVHCLATGEHTSTALTIISLLSEQCWSLHLVSFLAIALVYIIEYRNLNK